MKCSKGHEKQWVEEKDAAESKGYWFCPECLANAVDSITVKSPRDKMIRSKDLITKRDERKRKIRD